MWVAKLAANRDRDSNTDRQLRGAGWTVLRFFEHDDMATAAQAVIDPLLELRQRGV